MRKFLRTLGKIAGGVVLATTVIVGIVMVLAVVAGDLDVPIDGDYY